MSFLSILLFISAFYFIHARPDASTVLPTDSPNSSDNSSEALVDDVILAAEEWQYDEALNAIVQIMSQAVDDYLMPIMSDLEQDKQDQLKDMAIDSFSGYFNYMILQIRNGNNTESTNSTQDFPLDKDDIIVELDTFDVFVEESDLITAEPEPEQEPEPEPEPEPEFPAEVYSDAK